jgi:predicted dehydrogenase
MLSACQPAPEETGEKNGKYNLVVLDPGHFHAGLVQKKMYDVVDSNVYVYAPGGAELDAYLNLVGQYNERSEDPTRWNQQIYKGADFVKKMTDEKKGNILVLAGNNRLKTEYIKTGIDASMHVLADKPMAINTEDFELLRSSFEKADSNKIVLYDIMTERSEITSILQRELSQMPEVFGEMQKGSAKDPAISMESVHYFSKKVSGKQLIRPVWFFDPAQQGNSITDVGTHLVDLVQWIAAPDTVLNYETDINIQSSRLWPTDLTISQFNNITNEGSFPGYLQPLVKNDTILQAQGNGEINYTIKGIHAKVVARWEYEAKEGGDTHNALVRGTKSALEIRQGKEENFQPVLYITPNGKADPAYEPALRAAIQKLESRFPRVAIAKAGKGWKVIIPENFRTGHEAHFAEVMERFLEYVQSGKLLAWEIPNMIAKYYTTTQAVKMAKQ